MQIKSHSANQNKILILLLLMSFGLFSNFFVFQKLIDKVNDQINSLIFKIKAEQAALEKTLKSESKTLHKVKEIKEKIHFLSKEASSAGKLSSLKNRRIIYRNIQFYFNIIITLVSFSLMIFMVLTSRKKLR